MRRLLTSWLGSGSTLLALAVLLSSGTLGCDKPKTEPAPQTPAVDKSAAETPAVEDATPEQDAAEEMKDEEKAAGKDTLDTSTEDTNVKLGEPQDPVDLK